MTPTLKIFSGTAKNDNAFPRNLVVVGHGMTMRLMIMAMFNKTVKEFETWVKPNNCEVWCLTKMDGVESCQLPLG